MVSDNARSKKLGDIYPYTNDSSFLSRRPIVFHERNRSNTENLSQYKYVLLKTNVCFYKTLYTSKTESHHQARTNKMTAKYR